ncbi:ABC transporter substrate-binding protein [Pseudoalteromonas haloplanktis]|uniref:ABC transporter substrate-binding protein n=1 Tax=Pseudoalteromonas haloplanktis TaxID=228 RepID=A0ABU1BB66_PSEHA|nr:ABC transporter substrate-binding protein [Pseudoalteromonas haloplanktis]MDQ9091731.1 ABC transporter substrate-binding protein [Pseudoalteromonas haloplanktis]
MSKFAIEIILSVLLAVIPTLAEAKKPLKVQIMTDFAPQVDGDSHNIATQFMLDIEKQLNGAIALNFIPASRLREWQQLHTLQDVCLYNKAKTPERLNNALFSHYPIMAFPANRLVVYNHPELPQSVSLEDAINKYKLIIGITSGRAYGSEIDDYIRKHPDSFMTLAGTTSALRLSQMLFQNKVDAIIEYSAVFVSRHGKDPRTTDIRYLSVENSNQAIFGYIACSRSDQGQQAIALFDQALQSASLQQAIITSHEHTFVPPEQTLLINALKSAFKTPKP